MNLFVTVTCWICIVAAAVDDNKDEIESLGVPEGGNLTISIHIKKSDEDPQVWIIHHQNSSRELIAQLICHDRVCEREDSKPGVSLISDGENNTLVLINVNVNQTGLYEVRKLSSTQLEKNFYNITVCETEPRRSTVSPEPLPSVTNRKSFAVTAGVTSASVCVSVLVAAAVIVVYLKRKKTRRQNGVKCTFIEYGRVI